MILLDTQVNIVLQNLGEWLVPVMNLFSFLGTESFYILIFPAIFWCLDTGMGIRLGLILLSTSSLNCIIKLAFHLPRPYWVDQKVIAYAAEPTFGFPSGHSQMAASVWGMLGFYRKNRLAMWAALFVIFMIGISRLYLGMHFFADVLAGWLFGFLVLVAFFLLDQPICSWISRTKPGIVFLWSMLPVIVFLGTGIFIHFNLQTFQIPESWITLAARGGNEINPVSMKDLFSSSGTWIGFVAGICWLRSKEKNFGKFRVDGTNRQKIWRYLLGITGIIILWAGLGPVFPQGESFTGLAFRLVRYGLVGGWISGLAPYIFMRMGLASTGKPFDVESTIAAQ